MGRRILAIDSDQTWRRVLATILTSEGYELITAEDGQSGLAAAAAHRPDLVLLDVGLPDMEGVEVLERLKTFAPELPVIMLSARHDLRAAVRATQLGALDYLTRPVEPDELRRVIRRALETAPLKNKVADLRRQVGHDGAIAFQMGPGEAGRTIAEQVRTVASFDFTVLVQGETGTGKELVAQAIHRESPRRGKPFVALDCGAIPEQLLESELFGHEKGAFTGAAHRKEGLFRHAEGGTFFLDEVGNLPVALQAKLLRVLESHQVQPVGGDNPTPLDVRFVAATNHDLQQRVARDLFRSDLYFRLAQYTIALPPLRGRPADIAYLTRRFLDDAGVEMRRPIQELVPDALELLQRYPWPGNVRELRNVVRQAVLETRGLIIGRDAIRRLLCGGGGAEARPAHASAPRQNRSLKEIGEDAAHAAEREAICQTLQSTRGNKSQAALALRTNYKTLHIKMKRFGVRGRDFDV